MEIWEKRNGGRDEQIEGRKRCIGRNREMERKKCCSERRKGGKKGEGKERP